MNQINLTPGQLHLEIFFTHDTSNLPSRGNPIWQKLQKVLESLSFCRHLDRSPLQDFQGVTGTPRREETDMLRTLRAETGKEQTCSGARIFTSRFMISFFLDNKGKDDREGERKDLKRNVAPSCFPRASPKGLPSTTMCNEGRA